MNHVLARITTLMALYLSLSGCLLKEEKCHTFTVCYSGISQNALCPKHIFGYPAEDVDTILTIAYTPNGRFDAPLDTFVYTNMDISLGRDLDTGILHYIPLVFSGGYTSSRLNDNAIVLKSIGRVYHLTEIQTEGEGAKTVEHWCDDDASCFRKILSLKVDGVYADVSDPNKPFILYK